MNYKTKINLLLAVSCIGIITVFFIPPIKQDANYHLFADTRTYSDIPNFYNVVSNILFLLFGLSGIILILNKNKKIKDPLLLNNLFFFFGIFLTGIGSGYYHLCPEIETLVWDRLPMTITFMAFFSIIISEYIDIAIGKRLLFHFLFLGVSSVLYWYKTELAGNGDLRFYALIQFLPLILIPLILLLFHKNKKITFYYWSMILVYVIAKVFETTDKEIFELTHLISGHSLKHIAAALAPVIYYLKLSNYSVLSTNKLL